MKKILTERELNVLSLLACGYTNNKISDILHISVHTTKAHLESIYDKLDISNRLQAVIKGIKLGLIQPNDILTDINKGEISLSHLYKS